MAFNYFGGGFQPYMNYRPATTRFRAPATNFQTPTHPRAPIRDYRTPESPSQQGQNTSQGSQYPTAIFSNLGGYLASGQHSDLQVTYDRGCKSVSVHKVVVCTLSKWFSRAVEGQFQESKQSTIALHDDYPTAVECMFAFMYNGNYEDVIPKAQEANRNLTPWDIDIHAYVAGDKYDIPSLREKATSCYIGRACELWQTNLRRERPDSVFRSNMLWEYDSFLSSITLLYAKTPSARDPMRQATINFCKTYFGKLSRVKFFSTMLAQHDEFRGEMKAALAEDGIDMNVQLRDGAWRDKAPKLRFTQGVNQPWHLTGKWKLDENGQPVQAGDDDGDDFMDYGDATGGSSWERDFWCNNDLPHKIAPFVEHIGYWSRKLNEEEIE